MSDDGAFTPASFHPTWPTLDAFYDEDERRRFSPEDDFGSQWVMEQAPPRYRCSRLSSTGEVILVNLDSTRVELVGWTPDLRGCQNVLKGWEHQHGPKSYYWVRMRFQNASGHRGAQQRKGNTHCGNEVTEELRNTVDGPTSLF